MSVCLSVRSLCFRLHPLRAVIKGMLHNAPLQTVILKQQAMIGIQAPSSFLLPGFALELLMSESTDCTVPKGGSGRVSWIQAIVEVSTKRNPSDEDWLIKSCERGERGCLSLATLIRKMVQRAFFSLSLLSIKLLDSQRQGYTFLIPATEPL